MSVADERARMVAEQIAARGVTDARVLDAMRDVPREAFVPEPMRDRAHADGALPVGQGQTISQPYMVALMAEAAAIGPEDRLLEVGAGTGYALAVFARLAERLWGIERIPALAGQARRRLGELGVANAEILDGDGNAGLRAHAPFDAIIVSAATRAVPPALLEQLAEDGRLVIPLGGSDEQVLTRFTKKSGELVETRLGSVRFVPLVG